MNKEITGTKLTICGSIPRNEIVKIVVNMFIDNEYLQKGKGITFRYPVEKYSNGTVLYISRPGHKKNFDFKVEVTDDMDLDDGTHQQIASRLRKMKEANPLKSKNIMKTIKTLYHCQENDVDILISHNRFLRKPGEDGIKPEVILKILKWMFIMEDIVYWDVEGRAFLYNFLVYVVNETDSKRLKEALVKVNTPDILVRFMKKADMSWDPY